MLLSGQPLDRIDQVANDFKRDAGGIQVAGTVGYRDIELILDREDKLDDIN
jgi:hypothetical protein